MNPPATFETSRLRLRPPAVADAAAIFAAYTHHSENVASQRVLEKVGMVREGVLRRWAIFPNLGPVPCDVWSFARIKETGSRP